MASIKRRNDIESHNNMRTFVEHAPVAIAMFDRTMRYMAASNRWIDEYHLGQRDIIGKSHYEIFPEITQYWREAHLRGLRGEVLTAQEDCFERLDGTVQWLNWEIRPWYTTTKEVGGIVILAEDITARKSAEAELDREREIFRALANISSDYFWELDDQYRYRSISTSIRERSGLDYQNYIGKTRWEIPFIGISDEQWEVHKATLKEHLPFRDLEAGIANTQGEIRWFTISGDPIFSPSGVFVGYRGVTQDITERKLTQVRLQKSEERYRSLFENLNAGFVLFEAILDAQGVPVDLTMLAANKNFESTTGLKPINVIGKRLTEVLPGIESDTADWIGTYGKVALTGEPIQFEQGSELLGVYYSVSAYQAAPNQCAVTFQDITEQRNASAKLRLWAESFEKLHFSLSIADASTNKFISVNPAFASERGYAPQELIGKSILSVFPDDRIEEVKSKIAQLDTQTHLVYESEHITKDGRRFPVLLDITTILSEDGKPLNRIAYALNMTDMFAAQQQIQLWGELFEKADFGLAITDATTNRFISVNPAYAREHGYERSELEGQDIGKIYPDGRIPEDMLFELGQKSHFVAECEHITKDGRRFPAQLDVTAIHNHDGSPDKRIIHSVDITHRKLSERTLLQHIEFTEGVIGAIPDLMFELDLNGKYINLWAPDPNLLANQKEILLGRTVNEILPEEASGIILSALKEASIHGKSRGQIICLDLPHGRCWFELSTSVMSNTQIQEQHFIMLSHEITDRKLAEERIQKLAYYDQLTALPNRRLFRDRLEQDMKRVERNKSSLALLFIDLDKFKEVNDTLGHDKGDILLIEAAKRIRKHVRAPDTLARLGGDEFAIILPEYGEVGNIDRVVQDVLHALVIPFDLGGGSVGRISGSIGIALYPQEASGIDELLKHSDQAMYAAKQSKTSRFRYFTRSMQEETLNKIEMINDLHFAIERNQLEVYFQPIVDARSGEIVKAEALLRWEHPVQGMISPTVFIPLAEESGLILSIGEWVFEETLRNIARWKENTRKLIQVSVNKSAVQFTHGEVHHWHESYLNSGLPEHIITVEITESLLLSDSEKIRSKFNFFKEHGIELSIDDFGTGFSALSYLNQFDVDYLKIDKSFVQKMVFDSASRALTEAIVIMAHKLGIRTIAEGVETEEQRDLLRSFECDYLQGYLYSKPITSDNFEKLLAGQN